MDDQECIETYLPQAKPEEKPDTRFWSDVRDGILRILDAIEARMDIPAERRNVTLRHRKH